jgi:hypothetical protein
MAKKNDKKKSDEIETVETDPANAAPANAAADAAVSPDQATGEAGSAPATGDGADEGQVIATGEVSLDNAGGAPLPDAAADMGNDSGPVTIATDSSNAPTIDEDPNPVDEPPVAGKSITIDDVLRDLANSDEQHVGYTSRRPELHLTPDQAKVLARVHKSLGKLGVKLRRPSDAVGWILDQVAAAVR